MHVEIQRDNYFTIMKQCFKIYVIVKEVTEKDNKTFVMDSGGGVPSKSVMISN